MFTVPSTTSTPDIFTKSDSVVRSLRPSSCQFLINENQDFKFVLLLLSKLTYCKGSIIRNTHVYVLTGSVSLNFK